jgi:hypothetical protein
MSLPFDLFIETMVDATPEDILAACATQKQWREYCHRPGFWSLLILRTYGVHLPHATKEDYAHIHEIFSAQLGCLIDVQGHGVRRIPKGILDLASTIHSELKYIEANACLSGAPRRNFTLRAGTYTPFGEQLEQDYTFEACTKEGAALKLHALLNQKSNGKLDCLVSSLQAHIGDSLHQEILAKILDYFEE